jgi:bifunctional non-homologous end joining protein LigD
MGRTSILPKRLQPMLATLTGGPFDDAGGSSKTNMMAFGWSQRLKTVRSRSIADGKVISNNYIEIAKALEGVKPTP